MLLSEAKQNQTKEKPSVSTMLTCFVLNPATKEWILYHIKSDCDCHDICQNVWNKVDPKLNNNDETATLYQIKDTNDISNINNPIKSCKHLFQLVFETYSQAENKLLYFVIGKQVKFFFCILIRIFRFYPFIRLI